MEFIRDVNQYRADAPCAVTLGKFDGVHKGHQKLLHRVKALARSNGWKTAAFTFDVSPEIRMGARAQLMLMSNQERAEILRQNDVDLLVECPFTKEIREMEAEDFLSRILVDHMQVKAIVVGNDFHFGKDRKGTPEFLLEHADKYGLIVEVVEKEMDGDREISSTYVREELALGHMEKVQELLGYPYFVSGEIVHGRHLGHSLGFPTINQVPDAAKMLPPNGVYFSRTTIGGKTYEGISNIGVKPTVKGDHLGMETYLFDCSEDLYGKDARVDLLSFRRPEKKFDSIEALKQQMECDINAADEYFQPL